MVESLMQCEVNALEDNIEAFVQFGRHKPARRYRLRKCPGTHIKAAVSDGKVIAYLTYVGRKRSQTKVFPING